MNNFSIGGYDSERKRYYANYETIGGGSGALKGQKGASGIQTHMTNTQNTPIEVLEMEYPVMINEYSLRKGSGGKGMFPGGDGLKREIIFLSDAHVTMLSERRVGSPWGLEGGSAAKPGENMIIRKGKKKKLSSKFSLEVQKGDRLRISTPGGGGWGRQPPSGRCPL